MSERATGRAPDPALVRQEAERLVAAGLAALSMAVDRVGAPSRGRGGAAAVGYDALGDMLFGPAGHRRHAVANDSPECCRCPVCKLISAARSPDPDFAQRLATGVGNLAEGAARVLRTVAPGAGDPPRAHEEEPGGSDPWAAATAATAAPPAAAAPTTGAPSGAPPAAGAPSGAPPAAAAPSTGAPPGPGPVDE